MLWTEKYKPETLSEVVNQKKEIKKLKKIIKNWSVGDKAALLYGPPGNGKTVVAYALANDLNYELIELNASDFRGKEEIKKILGNAVQQASLFKRSKLILIDEVDGISGRSDRGGVGAVIKVIKKSNYPIILTANDPWNPRLRRLRKQNCKLINFGRVGKRATKKRLREICEKEGIKADRKTIKGISDKSGGDLRAAINNLQAIAEGKEKIVKEDLEILGYREQKENIFNILKVVFKTHSAKTAYNIIRESAKSTDEIFWWIEQNISKEYEKEKEVAKAFNWLSKADIYTQRIRKTMYWRFKAYYIQLMSSGVAVSKKEMYHKFTRYYSPERLKKYGKSKAARNLRDSIAKKIAKMCHTSTSSVKETYIPYMKFIFKRNKQKAKRISESLDLSVEEVEFLS